MAIHLFTSTNPDQRFQPSSSNEMVQFFNGEAAVEDDAIATELDTLIARGRIPEITRVNIGTKLEELEKAEAKAKALRHVLAQLNAGGMPDEALGRGGVNSGAVVGVTTTSGVPQGKESIGDVSAKMAEPKKQAN